MEDFDQENNHAGHDSEHTSEDGQMPEDQETEDEYDDDDDVHTVAITAYNRVETLIELLIRKGVINEDEFDKMEEELAKKMELEFDEDSNDDSSSDIM